MSSSTKFREHMRAQKGVEDRRRDAVKVNELAVLFNRGAWGGGGVRAPTKHLNGPVKVGLADAEGRREGGWGRAGLHACLPLNEINSVRFTHCHGFSKPDNPIPEINCPIKMRCCPYRFNKLKMLV